MKENLGTRTRENESPALWPNPTRIEIIFCVPTEQPAYVPTRNTANGLEPVTQNDFTKHVKLAKPFAASAVTSCALSLVGEKISKWDSAQNEIQTIRDDGFKD